MYWRVRHGVFFFFSSRAGCLTSLLVSVVGTVLLALLVASCSARGF
jgi:hypothetical protein